MYTDEDKIFLGENYKNIQKKIPLVKMKFYQCCGRDHASYNIPRYDPTDVIAPDEIFAIIDDRVVNNIIPGRYLVSTYGRIFDRVTGRFINPQYNNSKLSDGTVMPYYRVTLRYYKTWNELGQAHLLLHRVVLLMFGYIKNAEFFEISRIEANHKNLNRLDPRLYNLEFVTRSENIKHSYNNGFRYRSTEFIDRNLPKDDPNQPIRKICSMMEQGMTDTQISKITGIDRRYLNNLRNGHTFQEFTKDYNLPKYVGNGVTEERMKLIIKACEMIRDGYCNHDIEQATGFSKTYVSGIRNKHVCINISKDYF